MGCTYYGRKYDKCFYSGAEWDKFHLLQDAKAAEIQKTEVQIKELFTKIKCLHCKELFLKACGEIMLDHNTRLMDQLDKEDPTGILSPSLPSEQ